MRHGWLVGIGFGLLVVGCAQKPPAPVVVVPKPGTGEGAYDLSGQSASCGEPAIINVLETTPLTQTLTMTNDGGWCALRMARGGKYFDAGLLSVMPQHGVVFIHRIANFTRIDYTPSTGYTGADHFQVKLMPGYQTLEVSVSVNAAPPVASLPGAPVVKASPKS